MFSPMHRCPTPLRFRTHFPTTSPPTSSLVFLLIYILTTSDDPNLFLHLFGSRTYNRNELFLYTESLYQQVETNMHVTLSQVLRVRDRQALLIGSRRVILSLLP